MSNNWLNRIFRSGRSLSRDDIRTYGSSSDQKVMHDIEERSMSSDFDSDAMEGWSQVQFDTSVMKRLDKKFKGSGSTGYLITFISVSVIVTSVFFFLNRSEKAELADKITDTNTLKEELLAEIRIDETDVVIPEEIEAMTEAPHHEQMQLKEIKNDFKELKQISDDGQKITIKELPIHTIDPVQQPKPAPIVSNRLSAKEVYLSDLKLIDYREYRSKPAVKTKQMVLNGVPANKETEGSEVFDPEWKETEIPYMDFIDKTTRLFNKGNYKKALARYQTVLQTYKDDVNALFYGGLCMYNLKEYDNAISYFESCLKGPYSNFDEEAQWMIALSAEKSGNTDLAKKYFKLIADQNGFYSGQAKEKLK